MNNVPVIGPKNKNKKEHKERKTVKSRTRTFELISTGEIEEQNEAVTVEAYDNNFEQQEEKENVETIRTIEDSLEERIARLELENNTLKEKNEQLIQEKITLEAILHRDFSVDRVKEDEKLFKFYTGLPDYETLLLTRNSKLLPLTLDFTETARTYPSFQSLYPCFCFGNLLAQVHPWAL